MTFVRLAFACLLSTAPFAAAAQSELLRGVPIFDTPKFAEQQSVIYQLVRAGAVGQAAQRLVEAIERFPEAPSLQVIKAQIAINQRDKETAIAALTKAVSLGLPNVEATLAAPEFRAIADEERVQALLDADPSPIAQPPFKPGLVKDGIGRVTAENMRWNADLARLEIVFTRPPSQKFKPVSRHTKGVMAELTKMVKRGQAAGNFGDIYDNRDAQHSRLGGLSGVQLTVARYDEAVRAKGLHYGLNEGVIFDGVAFGNSSTALKGKHWRSQARHAMSTQLKAIRAWQLYDNNHVYVFPEHRDHDPIKEKGGGDLFPANTPLMLISNGSSGSDKPFLRAIQIILAGFKPDVKALLTEKRLIGPTVQQVLRRGMKGIGTEDDYLSPAAHPPVFDQEGLELERILTLANSMTTATIPPRAQIAVVDEAKATGPFASTFSEELFTTPDAVARLWRGGERRRSYRLSAANSSDANGQPLTYFWRVISGDPSKISIDRVKPDASEVQVTIDWHEDFKGPSGLRASRIDIALFAHNGAAYSAPAMFSLDLPAHQRRVYAEDPSDPRPLSLGYLPVKAKGKKRYADPLIWPVRHWNDAFEYDESGNLLGWTRTYRKGQSAQFTRHGLKVLDFDAQGRPMKAEALRYQVARDEKGLSFVDEVQIGRVFSYAYSDESTRLGLPVEVTSD